MESSEPVQDDTMLIKLRNMWEFSNLMQYIFIFGRAVKIDEDFTIEVLLTCNATRLRTRNTKTPIPLIHVVTELTPFVGFRDRMSQAGAVGEAIGNWPCPFEICIVPPRVDVSRSLLQLKRFF